MAMQGKRNYTVMSTQKTKDGFDVRLKPEYEILKDVLHNHSYGGKRRTMIYQLLKSGVEFQVNGMHTVQTKNDPDLKKLIKDGKIEMFNVGVYGWGNLKCKHTYLRIKNG